MRNFEFDFSKKIFLVGAISCAIGFVYSILMASIGLIVFSISYIATVKEFRPPKNWRILKSPLGLMLIFPLLLAAGLVYSLDKEKGLQVLLRFLPFILLPMFFLTRKTFDKKEHYLIQLTYAISVAVFYVICIFNAFYRQHLLYERIDKFNWYYFYRYDFLEIFNHHPTYISMFSNLAISFMYFNHQNFKIKKTVLISATLVICAGILLSGSRMGYVVFLLITLLFFIKMLKFGSNRIKRTTLLGSTLIFIVLLVVSYNIPIVKERILYTFGQKLDYKYNNGDFIENKSELEQGRLLLWSDALDLIKKRPLLGYGIGSKDLVLKKKYKEENHHIFLNRAFNVHNTYLELLLVGGIPVLILFLIILWSILKVGIREKDFVIISFFIVICSYSITESIFRAQGIVFFAFYYSFLISNVYERFGNPWALSTTPRGHIGACQEN
jgi:O-antigen ligase